MKRTGSAVSGLDDKRCERLEKSKFFLKEAKPQKKNYQLAASSP